MSARPLAVRNTRDSAAVARVGAALDDAVALGAVDQAREVPRRDEHPAAQRRERLPVLALEVREEVEARPSSPRRPGAAHLAEHQVVALEQAHPEADVVSPRRAARPYPRGRS